MDNNQSSTPDVDPKTPRITQEEFGFPPNIFQNSAVIQQNDTEPTDSRRVKSNATTTPLQLSIPAFEDINTLPTPMAYTPLSPNMLASMSPTFQQQQQPFQQLNIKKRRQLPQSDIRNSRELDQLRSNFVANNRIVSELIVPPSIASQRIVSLPTVGEEDNLSISRPNVIQEPLEEADNDDELVITGYLLDDPTKQAYEWKKIKQIGVGNFSHVTLYESLDQSRPELNQVAVKKIKYPDNLLNNKDDTLSRLESSLTRELGVLRTLHHPCIVKLYGINNLIFIENKRPLMKLLQMGENLLPPCELIMSYCPSGDLLKELTICQGGLDIWLIQRLFAELVLAVKYLHDNLIIHRDLKLENILLNFSIDEIIAMKDSPIFYSKNLIQLGDFGLCRKIEPGELCTARCGSEDYVSPEILMGVPYDGHLTDTWALGVILYALLEDRLPFDPPANANQRLRNRPVSHRIARFEWRWFKLADNDQLDDVKVIVKNTLTRHNQRWTIDDIYNSHFIQDILPTLQF